MTGQLEAVESLRKAGYRVTPQRVMIFSIIGEQKGHHIGADRIHDLVQQSYPYIDIATVYRTLQLLKKLHLVTEINVGGGSSYELTRDNHHHHLVCRSCGETFDLSTKHLDELQETLIEEFSFHPDLEHFTLGGLCATCVQKAQPE